MQHGSIPIAKKIAIQLFAQLLGAWVGPDALALPLGGPLDATLSKDCEIKALGLGFICHTRVHKTHAFSKNLHAAQMCEPMPIRYVKERKQQHNSGMGIQHDRSRGTMCGKIL